MHDVVITRPSTVEIEVVGKKYANSAIQGIFTNRYLALFIFRVIYMVRKAGCCLEKLSHHSDLVWGDEDDDSDFQGFDSLDEEQEYDLRVLGSSDASMDEDAK